MTTKTFTRRAVVALVATAALTVTSCHREIVQIDKNNESKDYASGWEGRFGPIDPAQTWNMATQLTSTEAMNESYEWIVACEDLASYEDYDFNDAVFKVSHNAGEMSITITPLAAGSTYPTRLYMNGQLLGEMHQLIDPAQKPTDGLYTPLNTKERGNAGKPKAIAVNPTFSMNNMGSFAIQVSKLLENGNIKILTIMPPVKGKAPQMLMVPSSWAWPVEEQLIETAYPDFRSWSQSAAAHANWTTNVISEYVVK